MSDPGVEAGLEALKETGLILHFGKDPDSMMEAVLVRVDEARLQAGWVIVRTIPCDHHDTRRRVSDNEAERIWYCAQCGEERPGPYVDPATIPPEAEIPDEWRVSPLEIDQ